MGNHYSWLCVAHIIRCADPEVHISQYIIIMCTGSCTLSDAQNCGILFIPTIAATRQSLSPYWFSSHHGYQCGHILFKRYLSVLELWPSKIVASMCNKTNSCVQKRNTRIWADELSCFNNVILSPSTSALSNPFHRSSRRYGVISHWNHAFLSQPNSYMQHFPCSSKRSFLACYHITVFYLVTDICHGYVHQCFAGLRSKITVSTIMETINRHTTSKCHV